MYLEVIWDERNMSHATERASIIEIGQAIRDAPRFNKGRTDGSDRARLTGTTKGGRRLEVVVEVRSPIEVRPIIAWEI